MAVAVDLFIVYEFVKRLSTPFNETDAFKLGLIAADGKKLKNAKTPDEKKAMTYFDRLVFNLKRILGKFGLNSKISSFAAALVLMKEQNNPHIADDIPALKKALAEQRSLVLRGEIVEDAVVNNVGGGAIAGTGDNPPGRSKILGPILRRKKKLRYQDRQRGRY